ncbi:hypothetical protein B0H63DRAFT_430077 [Podospora didyma]|uniref:Chromo domain-containing protein n=1 Tax=Podospora didyma TaxID=330526 RepID=A0AAE0P0P7_9PEZI|nr:hypothetical protein B0H63DRAFT_430077 [Podospora didyma]
MGRNPGLLQSLPAKAIADNLALAVPLRSPEGISALEDLIALLTNDSRVAYQQALQPIGGCCPIPSCARQIERIPVLRRWEHVYRCSKDYLERQNGFAAFCSLCSEWITKAEGWQIHCQSHTDGMNIPFRYDPVIFRRAMARFGYCPCCLGNTSFSATQRMRHFENSDSWKRYISECIPEYIATMASNDSILCPHPRCRAPVQSEPEGIWEVEALLARWKQGRKSFYLVKWKGFSDEENTWELREEMSRDLVVQFDAAYSERGGNHFGVELLNKRTRRGKVEYFVKWKGRPTTEDSWEKESTISRERIIEFEL